MNFINANESAKNEMLLLYKNSHSVLICLRILELGNSSYSLLVLALISCILVAQPDTNDIKRFSDQHVKKSATKRFGTLESYLEPYRE